MTAVFIWTIQDAVQLVLLSIIIVVTVVLCAAHHISKWRKGRK